MVLLTATLAVAETSDGWRQVSPGYQLQLPRDHASHPAYRVEWWYYTGNVAGDDGRHYGYQLTFFRIGVDPAPANPSRWAVRDLFVAHLAVTDIDGSSYAFAERANRAGVGWAGAATDHYRVWNDDWSASLDGQTGRHVLDARDGPIGVSLELEPVRPAALNGMLGYSRKGADAGNASEYYSLTRMTTRGTIVTGGRAVTVEGLSWMDHEFGTSLLEPGQTGWDWFSIQLDDGTDLMVFQLRRADGARDVHSSGTLVDPTGASSSLRFGDFDLAPGRRWRSPASNAEYPVAWHVEIPSRHLGLDVRAAVDDQELRTDRSTGVTYWEGAITVAGEHDGRRVTGRGYLEMTGYAGVSMDRVLQ